MALEVKIKKGFGNFMLDVAFETSKGITGLLGASGCGKSLTLKCIAGILKPDEGYIALNGKVFFDSKAKINLSPQERRIGYLFQNYALFPTMTVLQNIEAGIRNKDKHTKAALTGELMQAFQLTALAKQYPYQLSGGQQQRVALVRILAGEPQGLLLDEPFSALDSYVRWQAEMELCSRLASFNGPVVLVTHDRNEIYRMCHSVCILNRGHSEEKQDKKEIFDNPVTLPSCLLSGCKNISRARILPNGKIEAADWGIHLEPGQAPPARLAYVGVRSHFIRMGDGFGKNCFLCKVEKIIEDVFATVILLHMPTGKEGFSLLRMEVEKTQWAMLHNPEMLWIQIPPDCLLLLTE